MTTDKTCNNCKIKQNLSEYYKGRAMCKSCVSLKRYIIKYQDIHNYTTLSRAFKSLMDECYIDNVNIESQSSSSSSSSSPSKSPPLVSDPISPKTSPNEPPLATIDKPVEYITPQRELFTINNVNLLDMNLEKMDDTIIEVIRTQYHSLNKEGKERFLYVNVDHTDQDYFLKYIVNKYYKPYLSYNL